MQTFRKEERLCSATEINRLFREGRSLFRHPIKLIWLPAGEDATATKLLISVPKHNFKQAVKRNRIKRIIREIYRKNKRMLAQLPGNRKLNLGLIYIGKEIPEYNTLESIIIQLFQRLIQDYEKASG